jgi:F420-0:gamma-glutamyl ligase
MAIDLEELRQKKAFEELQAERTEEPTTEVTTAFLVVQGLDGQWTAMHDFAGKEFTLQRDAIMDDIVGGCSNIMVGAQVQQTGVATVILMEQRAHQMQQQMIQQQQMQHAASLIDPSKLRA